MAKRSPKIRPSNPRSARVRVFRPLASVPPRGPMIGAVFTYNDTDARGRRCTRVFWACSRSCCDLAVATLGLPADMVTVRPAYAPTATGAVCGQCYRRLGEPQPPAPVAVA